MQHGVWIFKLKPGAIEDYCKAHKAVWPELIDAERRAGLRNHSCHILGDTVVAYGEAVDLQATMHLLASDPVNLRWNEFMRQYMEDVDGLALQEIFHFE
jgi:L-rhamnose mutarotase